MCSFIGGVRLFFVISWSLDLAMTTTLQQVLYMAKKQSGTLLNH